MADLSVTNTFVADTDATAEDVNQNFEDVETAFNSSIASILADSSTAGRIIVVDGSGVPTFVTPSGDVAVSNAGALTLNNNTVDSAEIVADAVGTSEIGALPSVLLDKTAAQSIANDTVVGLEFNNELYDVGGLHAGGADNERITIATAGVYLVHATVVFDANNTGRRDLGLWCSDSAIGYFAQASESAPSNTVDCVLTVAAQIKLAAADYLECRVKHTKGAAWDVLHTSNDGAFGNKVVTRFGATWLCDG